MHNEGNNHRNQQLNNHQSSIHVDTFIVQQMRGAEIKVPDHFYKFQIIQQYGVWSTAHQCRYLICIQQYHTIKTNKLEIKVREMIDKHDYAFKIVIVGNQGVGKSSLFLRFCDRSFVENYLPTIGVDFRFKNHQVDQYNCKLQIWDTAGQQRFRTITSAYYRCSQAVLIVYDLTDAPTFQQIQDYWLQQAKNNSDSDAIICLVGNKTDAKNKMDTINIQNFCRNTGLSSFYVSAKTGEGVDQMFTELCTQMIQSFKIKKPIKKLKSNNRKLLGQQQNSTTKKCCGK